MSWEIDVVEERNDELVGLVCGLCGIFMGEHWCFFCIVM